MQPCCSGAVKCPNSNGMLCLTNICI
jgi:hypothetical protein